MARAKGFRSASTRLASPKKVDRSGGVAALTRKSRVRAIEALNRIYKGDSIERAAREAETTVANVKRYAGAALRKDKRGRIVARKSDQLAAVMDVMTAAGKKPLLVVGSRSRSLVGAHNWAVRRFLETGRVEHLRPFIGKTINVAGEPFTLVTDPHVLTRLGREGRLSIVDSIYAKGAA